MELPSITHMVGNPSESTVKWQLCYDMTAKTWWMVSRLLPSVCLSFFFFFPSEMASAYLKTALVSCVFLFFFFFFFPLLKTSIRTRIKCSIMNWQVYTYTRKIRMTRTPRSILRGWNGRLFPEELVLLLRYMSWFLTSCSPYWTRLSFFGGDDFSESRSLTFWMFTRLWFSATDAVRYVHAGSSAGAENRSVSKTMAVRNQDFSYTIFKRDLLILHVMLHLIND